MQRARAGTLVLRMEDLDRERCKPEFDGALLDDLRWYGIRWQEGPDVGGPFPPYRQTNRLAIYREAWKRLAAGGHIYPCTCTRRDHAHALGAPHAGQDAALHADPCRPAQPTPTTGREPGTVNWRFRAPTGETVRFDDRCAGPQAFTAGQDFGDFIVWRRDGFPAYQLAVVVDDATMEVTEVVRGADLLPSTAQQILLYRALAHYPPTFYHSPLVLGADGQRLAKRAGSHSLRALRAAGVDPATIHPTSRPFELPGKPA